MPWFQAEQADEAELEQFLIPREIYAASLTSRLKSRLKDDPKTISRLLGMKPGSRISVPRGNRAVFLETANPGSPVRACIYIEKGGMCFPIFSDTYFQQAVPDSAGLPKDFFRNYLPGIFSAMGMQSDVRELLRLTKLNPVHMISYTMMYRDASRRGHALEYRKDWSIQRGNPRDGKLLMPLQLGYEEEEVVIPGKQVNPRVAFHTLMKSLEEQRLIYLVSATGPAGKAQTNARGITVEQIGGVYTSPSYRSKGIGAQLVERLSREIIREGKGVSLFVKTENAPAKRLYEKCGFLPCCDFGIYYFS